jgi:hypothetical protein
MIADMITKDLLIDMFMEVLPECRDKLAEISVNNPNDESLSVTMNIIAGNLVDIMKEGNTDNLSVVFSLIEDIYLDGDQLVKNSILMELIENIQQLCCGNNMDPDLFKPFMRKNTAYWWDDINEFWNAGNIKEDKREILE